MVLRLTVLAMVLVGMTSCGQSNPQQKAAFYRGKALLEAQEIYHRLDPDGDGTREYAQTFSGPNGLLSVPELADMKKYLGGAELEKPEPGFGYVFKILKAQGSFAPRGKQSYIDAQGNMTDHAFIAYPEPYGPEIKMTLIGSSSGLIYKADLGPDTAAIVKAITEFDPDPKIWTIASE